MGAPSTAESDPLVIPYGVPVVSPTSDVPYQPYLLLPLYRSRRRSRACHCICSTSSLILSSASIGLLLFLALVLFYPTDPDVQLVRLKVHHIRVVTNTSPVLDISLDLHLRVRNPNFFSLDYESLVASIAYRGRDLGFVTSGGQKIKARQVSYVDARLRLDGVQFVSDMFYLIQDLAKGLIPFDTTTKVDGKLQVLFLDIPIKGAVSCSLSIDPVNQIVLSRECYP